jgi:hypothetical protein
MAGLDLDDRTALPAARKRKGHEGNRATPAEDLREVRRGHPDQRTQADDVGVQIRAVQPLGFLYSMCHDRRSCHYSTPTLLLLETVPTIEGRDLPDADCSAGTPVDQPYGGTRKKTRSLSLMLYKHFYLDH